MMALLAGVGSALAQAPSAPATPVPAEKAAADAAKAPAEAPKPAGSGVNLPEGIGLPGDPASGDLTAAPGANHCGGEWCSHSYSWYGSAEYLLFKLKDAAAPPTQITLPITQTGLNQQTTSISIGGVGVDYGGRSGMRFTLGHWCDPDHCLGAEISYFQFERRDSSFFVAQQANLPLAVTIQQNVNSTVLSNGATSLTTTQIPLTVQLPAVLTISATGAAGPTNFWGGEANLRSTRCVFGGLSIDFLAGFRYINLSEEFVLNESIILQSANANTITTQGLAQILQPNNSFNLPPGIYGTGPTGLPIGPVVMIPAPLSGLQTVSNTTSVNNMTTHNQFYAAQIGASWEWWITKRLTFNGYGKVAAGAMVENFTIQSNTTVTPAASTGLPTTTNPGGILPVTGFLDMGRTRYAVAPELQLTFGYNWTPHIRTTIGYNFLYLSSVMRPGDQIVFNQSSANISVAGTPNTVTTFQPSYVTNTTDFWAQGLTAGFEIRY
jgi:hypothetical protein